MADDRGASTAPRDSRAGQTRRDAAPDAARPTLLVDSREQNPFNFSRFKGWFAGIEKKPLQLGDYSIAGLEDICVVERKDLSDLIHSCTTERIAFVKRLKLMAAYPHPLLVVTSTLSQMKSPYAHTNVDPNRTTQSLIAALADCKCLSSAARRMNWAKNSSVRTSIRFISTTGWSPTTTAGFCQTTICRG
jgi:ERCC4-type nuclease